VSALRWTGLGSAILLAAAGCGSGGEGSASPTAARRCLSGAGFAVVEGPASPLLGTTAELDVTRGRLRAGVYFFSSQSAAGRDAVALGRTLASTSRGLAVQRGRVVVGYARRPSSVERDRLEGCLG
jgi:hypothetical protein